VVFDGKRFLGGRGETLQASERVTRQTACGKRRGLVEDGRGQRGEGQGKEEKGPGNMGGVGHKSASKKGTWLGGQTGLQRERN